LGRILILINFLPRFGLMPPKPSVEELQKQSRERHAERINPQAFGSYVDFRQTITKTEKEIAEVEAAKRRFREVKARVKVSQTPPKKKMGRPVKQNDPMPILTKQRKPRCKKNKADQQVDFSKVREAASKMVVAPKYNNKPQPFTRPKAEYSNTSPYGIAAALHFGKNI
jgi:hypothetical protein